MESPPIRPDTSTPLPITLYDGDGGASEVQGYRYPHKSLEIVTHGGKRTAQVFCRPRSRKSIQNNNLVRQSQPISMEEASSYLTDMTDMTDTVSVVSNLSELSELSTLQGVDEDIMTLKRKNGMDLPELHGPKKDSFIKKQTRMKKGIGTFEMLTHQRDIAIKEKNQMAVEMSKLSSQNDVITNLKQKEIFLLREKNNLESELKGLHQNMKKILDANIALRNEISTLKQEQKDNMSQERLSDDFDSKLKQLRDVIEILKEENLAYAKEIDEKSNEIKEINAMMRNSKMEESKAVHIEREARELEEKTQQIILLEQSLSSYKLDLEATVSSKLSLEQEIKIARQELESVTHARDWYQKQMKESQQLRANAMKDTMILTEDNVSLKTSNESMLAKIKTLENEIEQQKTTIIREKEMLVAKLELIDKDMDDSTEEGKESCKEIMNQTCQTDSEVVQEKYLNDVLEDKIEKLELVNSQLKEELSENKRQQGLLKRKVEEASFREDHIKNQVEQFKEENTKEKNNSLRLEAELTTLKNLEMDQDEKIKTMEQDLGGSISLTNKLKKEISEYEEIIKSRHVEIEKQNKDFSELSKELSNIKDENLNIMSKLSLYKDLDKELNQKNEEILKLKEDLKILVCQKSEWIEAIDSAKVASKSLNYENECLLREKTELLTLNTKLSECVQNLECENESLLNNNQDLKKKVDSMTENLGSQSRKIEKVILDKKEIEIENVRLLKQFNDEKDDLENVIRELENVQEKMLKDRSKNVSFDRELFEKLQNADRENKEKIKILDSNLKNAENRIKEQINLKDVYIRELEEVQEARHQQENVILLLEDKINRIERELNSLKKENELKDENLETLKIDLLELEKDRGTLSAVLFENKALQENCALLEQNLQTLNQCQGKVSVLEHNLIKSKETIHEQKDHILTVSEERTELKEKCINLELKLSSKEREYIELNDDNKKITDSLRRDLNYQIEKNAELMKCIDNSQRRNLELETKYSNTNETLLELKNKLVLSDQNKTLLEEKLTSVGMSLEEKTEAFRIKEREIEQKKNLHKVEIENLTVQLSRLEKNFNERETTIHSLRRDKETHQKQLKQMQLALKTSLHHIRGLRTIIEDSHNLPAPKFDEQTLSNLLHLNTPTERPKLSALKLCLADLRQDVRELNIQLSDKSRGSTPTERPMDRTDTPSFLDRFQGSTLSPSNSSGTPSLNISLASSPNTSPEHRFNKFR